VSDPSLVALFVLAAAISLAASWVLVSRLGRVGARLGMSEALIGMLTAVAADAPEITAAVAALVRHDHAIGAGVVIGSNVFNLAALLGLSAVVAGWIALHRRVVLLSGVVAVWIAAVTVVVVLGAIPPVAGLGAVLVVFLPYLAVLALPPRGWLALAVHEEEQELEIALHPRRAHRPDVVAAALAIIVVVAASVGMEHTATTLGLRHAVSGIVIGGIVLAGVTSLPNAVGAVYFARRGRGAAVLSTALNSNAINILFGLLVPASIFGLGSTSGETTFLAAAYALLTALALLLAYLARGLRSWTGALIILGYATVVAVLLATS
jgi:cation:H+ antiporter